MTVDLCMAYMLMLVSMSLTLMQGHSGSTKPKNQCWIILTTKQAVSIKLPTFFMWKHFENIYMAWPALFCFGFCHSWLFCYSWKYCSLFFFFAERIFFMENLPVCVWLPLCEIKQVQVMQVVTVEHPCTSLLLLVLSWQDCMLFVFLLQLPEL